MYVLLFYRFEDLLHYFNKAVVLFFFPPKNVYKSCFSDKKTYSSISEVLYTALRVYECLVTGVVFFFSLIKVRRTFLLLLLFFFPREEDEVFWKAQQERAQRRREQQAHKDKKRAEERELAQARREKVQEQQKVPICAGRRRFSLRLLWHDFCGRRSTTVLYILLLCCCCDGRATAVFFFFGTVREPIRSSWPYFWSAQNSFE